MKKKLLLIALFSIALFVLSACSGTDVVGKISITSFDSVLKVSDVQKDEMNGGWSLSAPDRTARFIWSRDFDISDPHDVMLELDAKPFITAGLDTAKLPAGKFIDGKIMVGQSLGDASFPANTQATALASYEQLVKIKREMVGYHEKLDHYGVDVGDGNKFEWAKDMSKNDKDIVFVLDPKMFTDAGVDPAKVAGWAFAKVEVKDATGKPIEVEKFLKPFNLV